MPILTNFDDLFFVFIGQPEGIYGLDGNDQITGGAFNDQIYGGNDEDYILGGGGDDVLAGGSGTNQLFGGDGNDVFYGGAGANSMYGEKGDDSYYLVIPSDIIVEKAGEGIDTVYVALGRNDLIENVENFIAVGLLTHTLVGNGLDNLIVGNDKANVIDGGGGNDRLEGRGGNDSYAVYTAATVVIERPSGGTDTINLRSTVTSYAMGDNVENLETAGGGTFFGNASNNQIHIGVLAAAPLATHDTIDGGAGADIMAGGLGDDAYYVDNPGDKVQEAADQGTDRVIASVSHTLHANVEILALTGLAAINGTGNASNNTISGNAAANTLDGGAGNDTLEGGLGADTYIVDVETDTILETGPGVDTVFSNAASFTLGANVENMVVLRDGGTGVGNTLNNKLTGGAGTQNLNGGLGADDMRGGEGSDAYVVDNALDVVVELANQGIFDQVFSSISYTLPSEVEYLLLLPGAINGTGNASANTLQGNDAANVLNGLGGADRMIGGLGNDAYIVDNPSLVAEEYLDQGLDTVYASVSYVLGPNVENLILTGVAAINGTGNAQNNRITGNAAANKLDGGLGDDVLTGGLGADTYTVDVAADRIVETGADIDTVISTATTYTLGAGVENLTVLSVGGQGVGNAFDNKLTGAAGTQILVGGLGADEMRGGLGDDAYYVDNVLDKVVELANQGIADQVLSAISYTLGAHVEALALIGTAAINGTGNNASNTLSGNTAANVLDGGLGADQMLGGAGGDTYIVDNAGDTVTEFLLPAVDTVNAAVSFVLSDNVENLNLTGMGAIAGTGNDMVNRIVGNGAANTIDGKGGSDLLTGGLGADVFVFSVLGGVDIITDFNPIDDSLRFFNPAFGNQLPFLVPVTLISGSTPMPPPAQGGGGVFLYDTDDGRLFVDLDGQGPTAQFLVATLTGAPLITAADFQVAL